MKLGSYHPATTSLNGCKSLILLSFYKLYAINDSLIGQVIDLQYFVGLPSLSTSTLTQGKIMRSLGRLCALLAEITVSGSDKSQNQAPAP